MTKVKIAPNAKKSLGLIELIAIALGGMVGGGIFSILGISVEYIGNATPIAIILGGILASFAAYSYVKLALYYKDEGATYSFFKKAFPTSPFASSAVGWLISFGYISTLALYAFTFSSYLCSVSPIIQNGIIQKLVAGGVILLFSIINIISVRGMGIVEDGMVYVKVILLVFISVYLAAYGKWENFTPMVSHDTNWLYIVIIAAVTFVSYEGFQLVIHAYKEIDRPEKKIPKAIYSALLIAIAIYVILAIGAIANIPKENIIRDKEFALAAGAGKVLGNTGLTLVILGALLATSSAISGTLFGASRLMAVISDDGYFPKLLSKRRKTFIPYYAILCMAVFSFLLILSGGLKVILEFGSITFIMVSFLMAYVNYKKRNETKTHIFHAIFAMSGLFTAGVLIFYFEYKENPEQLIYICSIYAIIIILSALYSAKKIKKLPA